MNKYLVNICIGFQAFVLINFMVRQTGSAVFLFIAATASEMFLVWLDRKKAEELDQLKLEMDSLKSQMSNISMSMGLMR